MSAVAMIGPKFYAWDSDTGEPLAGGKVYTYQAGTNTLKTTWTTEGKETANPNPVILNAAGYADIYLDGSYKIKVTDADDVEVWTSDPVSDASQLQKEWIHEQVATRHSTTEFDINGNVTDLYTVGRAIRVDDDGFKYGYIKAVTYLTDKTRVTVEQIPSLTASLSKSWVGLITDQSVPFLENENRIVDSVDTLRTSSFPSNLNRIYLFGYYGKGTPGGNRYFYRVGSGFTSADDDDGKNIVDNDGVKWRQVESDVAPTYATEFGAKGDGVNDDTSAIQAAYDFAASADGPKHLVVPAGSYVCSSALIFDEDEMLIEGQGRKTSLDHSGRSTAGDCVVLGNASAPNNTIIRGFEINGNSSLNGLVYNNAGSSINVARTRTEGMFIIGCGIGIKGTYWTTSLVLGCVISNCDKGAELGAQVNNVGFFGVWFSNINGRFLSVQNCDSMHFGSCLFQNLTDASESHMVSVRQSTVTMTDPYFEGLNNAQMAIIGGGGDTAGAVFKIYGGRLTGGVNIEYRQQVDHQISIEGAEVKSGTIGIVAAEGVGSFSSLTDGAIHHRIGDMPSLEGEALAAMTYRAYWYDNFERFGNATIRSPRRDRITEQSVGSGDMGLTMANNELTPGEIVTLRFALRIPTGMNVTLEFKDGGTGGTVVSSNSIHNAMLATTDPMEVRYIPMEVPDTADTMQLTFTDPDTNGPVEVHHIILLRGCVFPRPDVGNDRRIYNDNAPSANAWELGDIVYARSPSAGGKVGWVCVASGTPGTWKPFGAIDA